MARWSKTRPYLHGLVLSLLLSVAARGTVRPDYTAARIFGVKLQQDFAKRHSAAIIERLDEQALRKKVFAAYTEEVASSAEVTALWTGVFYPGLLARLKELDGQEQMVLERVLSLDGTRLLECELVSKEGNIQLVDWELAEDGEGRIHIVDQRILGEELSYSRRLKDLLLLEGYASMVMVSDDEMDLERESAGHHMRVKEALTLLGNGAVDEAFRRWSELPEEIKHMAIWRDLRLSMAYQGSERAIKSLQADVQEGKPGIDPLLRYNVAIHQADYAAALREMDRVLMETHDAPLFQALKCELLTKTNRAKEGLQMATTVYQLNPYAFAAYLQAAKAAVALPDLDAAQAVMRDWAQVYPAPVIDGIVKTQPELEKLRQTPAYQEWLKATPPAKAP
jgi:hypothetical protein